MLAAAPVAAQDPFRIAFYNTELARSGPGILLRDILRGDDPQVQGVVGVINHIAPDIIVLSGIDYDFRLRALNALNDRLGGTGPEYPYAFSLRPNTGWSIPADVDGDGRLGGPADAHGYGEFSGQGGLAILSKFPILEDKVVDHSRRVWADLGLPAGPPENAFDGLRLSTKAHWEVPIRLPSGEQFDIFTWHATPPVFDGPEDRNGRRNYDETVFWLDRLEAVDSPVVVAGNANADPIDGDGLNQGIRSLLDHSRLQDPEPRSRGGEMAARIDGGVNLAQLGDPSLDTVDWRDGPNDPGNLRVSYVLPSLEFDVLDAGVFWPAPGDPDRSLIGETGNLASRHRLLWVDLVLERAP